MPKITIMGAGGFNFPARLTFDILSFPELQDSTISDISEKNLERAARLLRGAIDRLKLPAKLEATTDRRKALDGADYVFVVWQVGGIDAYRKPLASVSDRLEIGEPCEPKAEGVGEASEHS